MRHDQVGSQFGLRAHRIVHRAALLEIMPENLRPGHAIARAMLGRQRNLVDLEHREHLDRRRRTARKTLNQELAPPASALRELEPQPSKLRGECIMDKENVHDIFPADATSVLNRSASCGRQTSWAYFSFTARDAASPSER